MLTSPLAATLSGTITGADPKAAALYNALDEADFHRWRHQGLRSKTATIERQFVKAVKRADATGDLRDAAIVAQATDDAWQAAAYRLKARQARAADRNVEELRVIALGG